MKMDKKDIPKILLLIGIFVIALGLFFNFMKKEEPKKKVNWEDNNEVIYEDPPDEIIDDDGGITINE